MKLSIERGTLLKALAQAQSVVERRNTIPILANVLKRFEERGLTPVVATELEFVTADCNLTSWGRFADLQLTTTATRQTLVRWVLLTRCI